MGGVEGGRAGEHSISKKGEREEESNMYCTYMKVTPKNIYSTKEGILIRIYMRLLILFIN